MREIVTTKTCRVTYSRRKCEFQTKLRTQKTGFRKADIKRRDAGCGMRDAGYSWKKERESGIRDQDPLRDSFREIKSNSAM